MTVAYVLKMYPRFSETFILNEILELERRGMEVRIFSLVKPDDGRFHASLAKVKAKVSYLPEYPLVQSARVLPACRNLIRRDAGRFWKTFGYALAHANGMGLKQFLRACVLADTLTAEPVDHLHAHFTSGATSVAMLAHLFTGIPFSFTAHAKDIYLNSIDQRLLRDKILAAQFVVTVSDYNRRHLMELADGGRNNGRPAVNPLVRRLYNGIDLNQFDPEAIPQFPKDNPPLILSVGRLVEKKGLDDLIRACGLLRDRKKEFTCEIIGKGPQESALRELIEGLGLAASVHLAGPKPQDEIVSFYKRAAVFALPCIVGKDGNRDGLPTVLLEAMAMGLPSVSTRLTGIPEIIDDGVTGLLVSPQDPPALADALARLLENPALCQAMGQAARLKVGRAFNLRENVAVLHSWFENRDAERIPADRQVVGAAIKDSLAV